MKRKITKLKSKNFEQKLKGVNTFRITGPCVISGRRVTVEFVGTREEAEALTLKGDHNEHAETIETG